MTTRTVTTDLMEDWNTPAAADENKSRYTHITKGVFWEYSSPDRLNWSAFDDYTQDLIEKAYSISQKELILNHGFYAKDQYTVVFYGTLSFRNNKTGNVRGIRRGGKESYRTIFRLTSIPNSNYNKDPMVRAGPMYRNQKKNNRKASIVSQIDNFTNPFYSILYAPETYIIPSEGIIPTELNRSTTPNKRGSAGQERPFLSPRDRQPASTPRKYDIDNYDNDASSKLRRRFGLPTDRPPELKMHPKSSFIPASKLKHPFRQVSRFWGSQRIRQFNKAGTTVASKPKNQPSLKQVLDGFANEDLNHSTPVPRRKIRSRSVPNLESLMAMADQETIAEEGKWGIIAARGTSNIGAATSRAKFGEYRSHYRNNNS